MCLIQKEGEKSPFGPPVLCRTFSFDPPLLSATPSHPCTPPSPNSYTGRRRGPADLPDPTPASPFCLRHGAEGSLTYTFHVWRVHVQTVATGRH